MTATEINTDTVEYAQCVAREHEAYYMDAAVSVYDSKERHHNWSLQCLSIARRARDVRQYQHDAEQYLKYVRLVAAHYEDPPPPDVLWGRRVFISFCTDDSADEAAESIN
jgi:hypothetical protein